MSILTRRCFPAICAALISIACCQSPAFCQTPPLIGADTIGVFRAPGEWIENTSGSHTYQGSLDDMVFSFGTGTPGELPVIGAWANISPAVLAIGVFDNGYWYLDSSNTQAWNGGDLIVSFGGVAPGSPPDIPVVGDWNHDGTLHIGIVRTSPVDGSLWWYVQVGCANGAPACDYDPSNTAVFNWGTSTLGDIPVVGDWDQSGVPRIGVVRPASGVTPTQWIVNLLSANCQGDVDGVVNLQNIVDCNGYPEAAISNIGQITLPGSGTGTPVVGNWGAGYLSMGAFNINGSNDGIWSTVDANLNPWPNSPWNYGMGGDIPVVGPWSTPIVDPAWPSAPATPSALSINGGGSTGSALPGVTESFAFTFYDAYYGAGGIHWGQVFLQNNANGGYYCQLDWGVPVGTNPILDLYASDDGYAGGSTSTFGSSLSDPNFCTVSLASISPSPTDPSAVTVTLNYTFSANAAPGSYSVIALVYDNNNDPSAAWGAVGTWTIDGATAPTAQITDSGGLPPPYNVGDTYTISVTGSPGQAVTLSLNGGSQTSVGTIPSSGTLVVISGTWGLADVGNYTETYYVAGVTAVPGLVFQVDGPPDSPPAPYPNYLSSPAQPAPTCNMTGVWSDSSAATTAWTLVESGSASFSGSVSQSHTGCGSNVWEGVTGSYNGGVPVLTASGPQNQFDTCGKEWASTVVAQVTLAGCAVGAASELAKFASYTNSFGQPVNPPNIRYSGVWTLTTPPLTFSVGPSPLILLSTGDTNATITTTASNSAYSIPSVAYYLPYGTTNPGSGLTSANAGLNFPGNSSGVGSATGYLSASPLANAGSGLYTVAALVGGTQTANNVYIVVPPQVLMQAMYGEAHGQAVIYGLSDPTEQALGITLRNRFEDAVWFSGSTTYLNTITAQQVQGLVAPCPPNRVPCTAWTNPDGSPTAELVNAADVFDGSSTVTVASARCFFSPTAAGWAQIQTALASASTVVPVVSGDPRCFSGNRQIVYKSSVSPNTNGTGAPAFVFEQWRNLTDPAVVQIQ